MGEKNKEFKSAIKNLPTKITHDLGASLVNYTIYIYTYREELISVLFKLGQKVECIVPNLFYEAWKQSQTRKLQEKKNTSQYPW